MTTLTTEAKGNLARKVLRLCREIKKVRGERDDAREEARRQTQQRQLLEKAVKDQADRAHYFGQRPVDWHAGVWVIECAAKAIVDLAKLRANQQSEAKARRRKK